MILMSNNTKSSNQYNTASKRSTIPQEKNLWCREVYWKVIEEELGYRPFKETNGCHLRYCNRDPEECRGAHTIEDLKPFKHVLQFERLDKAKYNWALLYSSIIDILQKDSERVNNEDHKRTLATVPTMNFFEAMRTWREMACYYRKTAKELPSKKSVSGLTPGSNGYAYSEDVPGFYLPSNQEETAWCFSRLTRWCGDHLKIKQASKSKRLVTIWDICLATGLNCKDGVHEISQKICEDDFLTGSCSCETFEEIANKQDVLEAKILELTTQMVELVKDGVTEGFSKPQSKKAQKADPKIQIPKQITYYKNQLESLFANRQMHYTEYGMIPFFKQYELFKEEQTRLKEEAKAKLAIKESWDHGLVDNAKITKPVVKVSKFGKKK